MQNLYLAFYGFRNKPYVSIDGKPIKVSRTWQTSGLSIQVPLGEHKIIVCEKRILYTWYWWIMGFNIIYPLLCFRGFSGKQAGYDGECVTITFGIICTNQVMPNIKIVRQENSWNMTPLNANYNSLLLRSNIPLYIKSSSLDSNKVFRLKFSMIVPFILVVIIFSCAWGVLLIKNRLSYNDIIISCIVEFCVLAYVIYKVYKIKIQKSFSEYSKMSRIDICIKNK